MVEQAEQNNLYLHRDPRNNIIDGEPRALYWWEYRKTYESLKSSLQPGKELSAETSILLMGNNTLSPFNFDLKKQDRTVICGCKIAGKSAHITFTNDIHIASGALFDKDAKRQDHLYILPDSKELNGIGYHACYLPTQNQPLHIRLYHQSQIQYPDLDQPHFRYRKLLAELFNQYKVV